MYFMWLTSDEQRVWRKYLAMSARLQVTMGRQLQTESGLSLADYDVLVALAEVDDRGREEQLGDRGREERLGGCRVNELGERLGWEQSRLSHQLRRMRARGLVLRHATDDDRRGARVELTATGSSALAAAAPGHVELVRRLVFDGTSEADLRTIEGWADAVLDRLALEEPR